MVSSNGDWCMKRTGPLREFSAGYYAIDFRVTPFADGPMIDTHLFDFIEDVVYANTNAPIWFKGGFDAEPYFKPDGDEPMPTDILGLPKDWMNDLGIKDDNELKTFYVCKPSHAHHISQSSLLGNTFMGRGEE